MGLGTVNFGREFGQTSSLGDMPGQTNVFKPRILEETVASDTVTIKVGTKRKFKTVYWKWQEKDARPFINITIRANSGFDGPPPPDETETIYLTNKDGSINNEALTHMSREEVNLVLEEKKRLERYSVMSQITVGAEKALIRKNNAKPGDVLVAEAQYKDKSKLYPVFKGEDGNYYIKISKRQNLVIDNGIGGSTVFVGGGGFKEETIKVNPNKIQWQTVKLQELRRSLASRGIPRTGLQIEKPAEFGGLDYVSHTGEYTLTNKGGRAVWRDEKDPNKYYTVEGGFLFDPVKRYSINSGDIVKRAVHWDASGPYYLWEDGTCMRIEESQVQAEPKK